MIRKMQNIDINRVTDIWLKTNLKAHYFIPEQYWTSNYELVDVYKRQPIVIDAARAIRAAFS